MIKRALLTITVLAILLSGCTKPANTHTDKAAQSAEQTSQLVKFEETTEAELATTEPTIATDDSTEPVTEPAIENVTEPVTEAATEAPVEQPTEPATQVHTTSPTKPAPPAEEKTTAHVQTEAATTVPATQPATETQTEAATVNPAIAERDAWLEEWYHEAYAYPWDFELIEAELRAYGESLGMEYWTYELIESWWYESPQTQQWWTLEEWMTDWDLTPDNANWGVPHTMTSSDSIYLTARTRENCFARLDTLAARGTTEFKIYFELSEDGQSCKIYHLY